MKILSVALLLGTISNWLSGEISIPLLPQFFVVLLVFLLYLRIALLQSEAEVGVWASWSLLEVQGPSSAAAWLGQAPRAQAWACVASETKEAPRSSLQLSHHRLHSPTIAILAWNTCIQAQRGELGVLEARHSICRGSGNFHLLKNCKLRYYRQSNQFQFASQLVFCLLSKRTTSGTSSIP